MVYRLFTTAFTLIATSRAELVAHYLKDCFKRWKSRKNQRYFIIGITGKIGYPLE
jgi:hypothetical protein